MKRIALILAGGAGTRLRPLSSDENPKQFLRIFDGCSLLEKTFARVRRSVASVYISTSEQYAEKCAQQLGIVNILTEPSRRNNAPAITLCCHEIEAREGDVVIAVLPSDHFIRDEAEFGRVVSTERKQGAVGRVCEVAPVEIKAERRRSEASASVRAGEGPRRQ